MKLLTLLILSMFFYFNVEAGNGHPCPPHSPCWCANHPAHPACKNMPPSAIPIDDYIPLLLLVGIALVYKRLR